jgi:hypothetical protein
MFKGGWVHLFFLHLFGNNKLCDFFFCLVSLGMALVCSKGHVGAFGSKVGWSMGALLGGPLENTTWRVLAHFHLEGTGGLGGWHFHGGGTHTSYKVVELEMT